MDEKKKDRIIRIILVLLAILTVAGFSYALLTRSITGNKNYVISTNGLDIYLDESKNLSDVLGSNVIPVPDSTGVTGNAYQFSIVNNTNTPISYKVYIVENNSSTMPSYGVRYQVKNTDSSINQIGNINDTTDATGNIIYSGISTAGNRDDLELRLWLGVDAGNDCKNKTFSAHIEVEASQNITNQFVDASGANIPDLASNMIPVTYDGSNWIKADTTKKWYDYNSQWWANAVTVSDANRASYMSASAGTTISMDDINTMWVWIPRYEYESISSTVATEIQVHFLTGTAKDKTSGYYTHPAFTFGDEELTGIWVAKFETGYFGATSTATAQVNSTDATKIVIKPNVYSWRNIQVAKAFTVSRNMESANNNFGFTASEVDTHMMKNIEWGAAAYLSQSKYGKYGNVSYNDADKEIYQNKSSSFITGMSNGTPSSSITNTQVTYNVEGTGTGASTTGNIYGIYDMSGGAWEYIMGIQQDNTNTNTPMSGNSTTLNSGFIGKIYELGSFVEQSGIAFPDTKYYDLYKYGDTTSYSDYTRNIKGDATTETKGWYADEAYFVAADFPWFVRGGGSGAFSFNKNGGHAGTSGGFRLVLVK